MKTLVTKTAMATCLGIAWAPAIASPQGGPTPGAAQTSTSAQSPQSNIQDIIITANRRSESIQRSSLAIQAFGADALRSAGLSQATDLNKLVQGLQIATAGSTTQIYIRGVGDFSANPLANPGVAFNVDGVYVGRPEGVASTFFDIARLEVLKGPQGTLYGRNATGGAINLITNSPTLDRVKGDVNAELGNYSLFHLDAAVNIPLSDKIALRAAVNRIKRNGYLTDGTSDDDQLAARLKLLIKPSDKVSLLMSVDGARIRGNNAGYTYLPRRPGASAWDGTTSPGAIAYTATFNPFITPPAPNLLLGSGRDRDTYIHNDFFNVSAQVDWQLGFATFTLIPAYRHTRVDSLSYDAESQGLEGHSNQATVEARLGNSSPAFKWTAGAYFFHEHNPGTSAIVVGPALLIEAGVYNPRGTSYAAFGEATAEISSGLRLIGGARYTTEKRELGGGLFAYPGSETAAPIELERISGSKRFNSFTWKAGTEYDLAPRSLLFATASTGFKSGGLTQTVSPSNVYRPEKILAFEVGSRNRFLDDHLQVNVEGFHWTYKDQQSSFISFDTLANINFLTINAGRSNIYGINVDVVGRVTNADTIHVGAEYAHSRYSRFTYTTPIVAYNPAATGCRNTGTIAGPVVPLVVNDCSGFPLAHVAKWSGVADYTHSFELSSGAKIAINASARASSPRYLSIEFTSTERARSFVTLNSEATFYSSDRKYSLSLFVRNINNAKEYTGGQETLFSAPQFSATISPPRTYGVRGNLNF